MRKLLSAGAALVVLAPAVLGAQTPAAAAPAAPPLEVGVDAPDFALPGGTRYGVLRDPVRLSDFRGQTVILAFYPRARTSGCTIQMQTYRDQAGSLFRGGRGVVVFAISTDADTTIAAWARELEFPFLFLSDVDGKVAAQYAATGSRPAYHRRFLYVVGPDGKIAFRATPFREIDPTAYTELGEAIGKLVADTTGR